MRRVQHSESPFFLKNNLLNGAPITVEIKSHIFVAFCYGLSNG